MEKIGVYICTYEKENRGSIKGLKRAIESVKKQTYKNYRLYVIFDEYTDQNQIDEIINILPEDSYTHNVEESYGKKFIGVDNHRRWCCGGLNSTKHAVNKIVEDGINWVCRLDHDDWWSDDYLEIVSNKINELTDDYVFITTRGKLDDWILPTGDKINDNYYPQCGKLFHSNTCINFGKVPLRYEDPFLNGYRGPGDAWMWMRLSKYMTSNNLKGYYIPKITLFRESEGDVLK